jgi:putative peptidoglycan lipid II flippase
VTAIPDPRSGPRPDANGTPSPDGAPAPDSEAKALSEPQAPPTEPAVKPAGGGAQRVAAGILASRVSGLVREALVARYFGLGIQADALRAALRMPNVLQNLLGEGTLSASFIPVYSELLHQGRKQEAGRVAGAVFALLVAVGGLLSLVGVLLAPVLVRIFLWGFEGERRELTIALTRIIFPMTGVLVLSAWALGVLNSHRRFLLPYTAPVLWNAAIVATLLAFGGRLDVTGLAFAVSWGALVGGALQFLVQLPAVLRLERDLRIRWDLQLEGVRTALRNAGPAVAGRGVVQLSGWLDMFLASLLAAGALAGLSAAQTLYLLPVSLFGMSVAAAELPELARSREGGARVLRERIRAGLRRTAMFVVPTVVGYILIGRIVVGAVYQGGRFDADATAFVHLLLATYSLGLLASTATRLYSSAFYALHDTRTPARIAMLRVVVSGAIGAGLMLLMRDWYWHGLPIGAVALALGASVGAWLEWWLLRRRLEPRLEGAVGIDARTLAAMFLAALAGAGAAWGVSLLLAGFGPFLRGAAALATYGVVFFPLASMLGVEEAGSVLRRVTRRLRR